MLHKTRATTKKREYQKKKKAKFGHGRTGKDDIFYPIQLLQYTQCFSSKIVTHPRLYHNVIVKLWHVVRMTNHVCLMMYYRLSYSFRIQGQKF